MVTLVIGHYFVVKHVGVREDFTEIIGIGAELIDYICGKVLFLLQIRIELIIDGVRLNSRRDLLLDFFRQKFREGFFELILNLHVVNTSSVYKIRCAFDLFIRMKLFESGRILGASVRIGVKVFMNQLRTHFLRLALVLCLLQPIMDRLF